MDNKIHIAIVILIVFGLLVALGYVVSRSSAGISNIFSISDTGYEERVVPSRAPFVRSTPRTTQTNEGIYIDPQNLFVFSYPAKYRVLALQEKNAYPQKQYDQKVPDFIKATSISSSEFAKHLPRVDVMVFSSRGESLDTWLQTHSQIKRGYATQTLTHINGKMFYRFSDVKPDEEYRRGELIYRTRNDVPLEMYVTVSGIYAYAILFDYRGIAKPYGANPQDVMKTFIIK